MNRYRVIAVTLIFIAAFVLAILWRGRPRRELLETIQPADARSRATSAATPITASATPIPVPPIARPGTKQDLVQTVLHALNHKSIEFYGRVVDQYGHPVPRADVYAAVIYN